MTRFSLLEELHFANISLKTLTLRVDRVTGGMPAQRISAVFILDKLFLLM